MAESARCLIFRKLEDLLALLSLGLLLVLCLSEIVARVFFHTGIPEASPLIQHFTLLFACVGAVIAGREGRQLGIADSFTPRGRIKILFSVIQTLTINAILSALSVASLSMVMLAFDPAARVGFIPVQFFAAIIPLAFLTLTVRSFLKDKGFLRLMAGIGLVLGCFASTPAFLNISYFLSGTAPLWLDWLASSWNAINAIIAWPLALYLIISAAAGVPLFALLAGLGYLGFAATAGVIEVVPYAAYTMLTGSIIPAIPLFTLTGFILADSGTGKRLVSLVAAAVGWLRGGPVIAAVLVSAFFTTFTGASGVTILALGALLVFVLKENGYTEIKAEALMTASGAIGLLFPPSLAVIIYGSVAQVNILDLFKGGIIPGALLVLGMIVIGVIGDKQLKLEVFSLKRLLISSQKALGELLMPILIVLGYFSGFLTLVETGAFAVFYVIVLELVIRREMSLASLAKAALKSVPVTGGILLIIASARGLSDFLVDAQIPMILADLAIANIPSRWLFLLLLNVVLLITGCLMDLFSAIMIVAPLVIPVAELFGINSVHLGILFLTNLSLGFLTPPVGMNLFIASYTFNQPLNRIIKAILPHLLIQFVILILITYLPVLTTLWLAK